MNTIAVEFHTFSIARSPIIIRWQDRKKNPHIFSCTFINAFFIASSLIIFRLHSFLPIVLRPSSDCINNHLIYMYIYDHLFITSLRPSSGCINNLLIYMYIYDHLFITSLRPSSGCINNLLIYMYIHDQNLSLVLRPSSGCINNLPIYMYNYDHLFITSSPTIIRLHEQPAHLYVRLRSPFYH